MRLSKLLLRTLRQAPGDAEAISHQLLLRAGYIRRLASGIYSYLPLGLRVLQRLSAITRAEMDAAGAQELLLPALHPLELWQQTGRDVSMADVLTRVEARGGRFVLAPTHEEVVTALVAAEVESYRQLPVTVYQIQTKFRDEPRPRYGLLRAREFVMKDAYSFDASRDGMGVSYQRMVDAYRRLFQRCEIRFYAVEALAGAMGGDVSHEWMAPSPIGEAAFARCARCEYAANVEAAQAGDRATEPLVEHHTPGRPGIEQVVEFFADQGLTAAGILKCIACLGPDGRPLVAMVPGDREVLIERLGPGVRAFEDADFASHAFLVKGYIGPMGLRERGVHVVADFAVRAGGLWVTGANALDRHVSGAALGRDFQVDEWAAVASVRSGDPCPRCAGPLDVQRAVEIGHTFQLGLTYSRQIPGATFLDETGKEQPFWMGCYGIGLGRLLAVVAEEHHDEHGLCWPATLAPFQVHLIALPGRDPAVAATAERLYQQLTASGASVLFDDRDLSAGVKFADADLFGMPTQLVVGARGAARQMVERKDRRSGRRDEVALTAVAGELGAVTRGAAASGDVAGGARY
jgi:prolyl-tRNA synthetase